MYKHKPFTLFTLYPACQSGVHCTFSRQQHQPLQNTDTIKRMRFVKQQQQQDYISNNEVFVYPVLTHIVKSSIKPYEK